MTSQQGRVARSGAQHRRHRQAVVSAVQARPDSSRADVARRTGLSTSAVSSLVADLVRAGVLVERGATRPSAGGRPGVGLGIDPELGVVLGVHLGHAGTRVVVTGFDGLVRCERAERLDVDHEPEQTLAAVVDTARELVAEAGVAPRRVFGAGVAVSAPVLRAAVLGSPPMLLDWGTVDVVTRLREGLQVPVHLANDATVGALAEWRLGAGRDAEDLLYVMLSDGVGAGLVLGGRLHEGATGAAGEFGHLRTVVDGQVCRCGSRGCLETVVGARALVASLVHTRGPHATVEDLLDLADTDDVGALRVLRDAGTVLGTALAGPGTVLDPRIVVLGGDLLAGDAAGQVLTDAAGAALRQALPAVANAHVQVVRAQLGARSEVLGAALLAADRADVELMGLSTRC